MRYVLARYKSQQRDLAYRIYMADNIRIIGENAAKMCGGSYITARFADLLEPKPVDTRTGEEIVADVIKKAGIEVIAG